jgi:hypothetical protein
MEDSYDAGAVKAWGGLIIPRIPAPSSPTDPGDRKPCGSADFCEAIMALLGFPRGESFSMAR